MSTDGASPAAAGFSRLALAALAALAAACTSVNPTEATFEGTVWRVTAINGHSTPAEDRYRVEFADGRIGGRLGCNHFSGAYRIERETLVVEPFVTTEMACAEPHMTLEESGYAVLRQPMRMDWHSGRSLTLGNSAGSIALEGAERG